MLQRFMMRYLRNRGWIVFWLDPINQHCTGVCWLKEFINDENARKHSEMF